MLDIVWLSRYQRGMQLRFAPPATRTRVRFFPGAAAFVRALSQHSSFCLWDEGAPVPAELKNARLHSLPGGEQGKRWASLEKILGALVERGHERSQPLTVVGGGALLDLGAFAASLYRRGIPLRLVPTTLLGMVDAALGGKTAVDGESAEGLRKNFAGTFYPAQEVWIAPHFLESLPEVERLSGAGECWKMLWIAGKKVPHGTLLDFVRTGKSGAALMKVIRACLAAKIAVVQKDPLDTKRVREVLNFGHTVGHAIEGRGGVSHGEAVLWGMAVETTLLGDRGEEMMGEILAVLGKLGRPLPEAFQAQADLVSLLAADKKSRDGKIELSLLTKPGRVVKRKFSAQEIAVAIKSFPEFYRHAAKHLRA